MFAIISIICVVIGLPLALLWRAWKGPPTPHAITMPIARNSPPPEGLMGPGSGTPFQPRLPRLVEEKGTHPVEGTQDQSPRDATTRVNQQMRPAGSPRIQLDP